MNRPAPAAAPTPTAAPGPLVLAGLVLVAALTRLLPHPPNFSPVEAVALFGGAYFAARRWAIIVPLVAMMISDFALGLMNGGTYLDYFVSAHFLAVYASIVLCTVLGFGLRSRVTAARVLGYSIAGSVLFFLFTNLSVWATASPLDVSPACTIGLGACYVAAIPFFQWTVLGTLVYGAALFGGFALLRRQLPVLRAQTV
jgi:hypothetical protein